MTDHPITPPDELVEQWCHEDGDEIKSSPRWYQIVCAKAAHWGADQELKACRRVITDELITLENIGFSDPAGILHTEGFSSWPSFARMISQQLRTARRPNPPSLKEQAIFAAAVLQSPDETCSISELNQHWDTIRRALERLQQLEQQP